jgi:hypothetical protein
MNSNLLNDTSFLITSNNKKICMPWKNALENDSMTDIYDKFTKEEQENIQENITNRTCLSINNISQCFTSSGQLERCDQIEKNQKQEISDVLKDIDAKNNSPEKKAAYKELDDSLAKKGDQIDTLIKQYTSRQEMLNRNNVYNKYLIKISIM